MARNVLGAILVTLVAPGGMLAQTVGLHTTASDECAALLCSGDEHSDTALLVGTASMSRPATSRVRIFAPALSAQPIVGRLDGIEAGCLWLLEPRRDARTAIPISSIRGLELSTGHNHARGALIGALGGGVAFGLGAGLLLAPLGLPIGAIAGALAPAPEDWRPLPRGLLAPTPTGAATHALGDAASAAPRLRILTAHNPEHPTTGRFTGRSTDSLSLAAGAAGRVSFSVREIESIELSAGRRRAAGALTGGLLAGLGWLVVAGVANGRSNNSTAPLIFLWTPLAAGAGALVGGAVGAGERWVDISPEVLGQSR